MAIASLDNVGPATFRWLLSHGSPRRVWNRLTEGRLSPGPGARIDGAQISRWVDQSGTLDPAVSWARCIRLGIDVVTLGDPDYPETLADDPDPPVVLFRRGVPERVAGVRVAIVGTRRATGYGIDVAHRLGRELTEAGVSVVSGLALGIDAAAHRGAIAALAGDTDRTRFERPSHRGDGDLLEGGTGSGPAGPMAIVGANLEVICPRRNHELARQVHRHGVIYSEVPPGTRSAPWRFPVRNRLVAAMCDALVVVESAANGGSMHTVREALDRDRTVLAVPGPIGVESSQGTNQLIRDGAAPCLDLADVLAELGVDAPGSVATKDASAGRGVGRDGRGSGRVRPTGRAAEVLEAVGWRPVTLDGLATSCSMGPRELAVVLAGLESEGWIVRDGSWVERLVG